MIKICQDIKKLGLLKIIFFIGLFLEPLIIWPWGKIQYEIPRVWFINRWIEILILIGLLFNLNKIKRRKNDSTMIIAVVLLVLVAVISSIIGVDPLKSIMGNYYRQDGLLTLIHLIALFVFMIFFWTNSWINIALLAISLGSFFTSIITLIMSALLIGFNNFEIPHWQNRAVGATFGNPNLLAGYLLVTLPFIAYKLIETNKRANKIIWLIIIFIQLLAIIATNSWGGLIGILIFIFGFLLFKTKNTKLVVLIIIVGSIVITSGLYLKQSQRNEFSPESRERIIKRILLGVADRPIFGYGWSNADYAFEKKPWPIEMAYDVYVDKAHSTVLEVFATTGLIGLTIYLFIIVRSIWLLYKNFIKSHSLWTQTLFLSLILFLFHGQTNIVSIGEEIFFWFILGIIVLLN